MKKTKLSIIGSILILATFSACRKDNKIQNESITENGKGNASVKTATKDVTWTNYFRRTGSTEWTAGDATLSIPVTAGGAASLTHNIWLFGDSHIGGINTAAEPDTRPCLFSIRNGMMRQTGTGNSFATIVRNTGSGWEKSPFKFPENDSYTYGTAACLWPHHGFEYNDKIYAFFGAYDGSMSHVADYIAEFNYNISTSSTSTVTVTKLNNGSSGAGIVWGMWTIVSGNDVYVYGTKGGGAFGTHSLHVAKASKTNIKGSWTYWNGSTWVSTVSSAVAIASGLSNHVSIVKCKNSANQDRYVLINQEVNFASCNYGRNIYAFGPAASLTGPFTAQKSIYLISDTLPGSSSTNVMLTYDAQAHPELTNSSGLLISYNVNGNCTEGPCTVGNEPYVADGYRPKFIRVPLADIETGLTSVSKTW